eukprot:7820320-Pyramimonas_sp.AAC.1
MLPIFEGPDLEALETTSRARGRHIIVGALEATVQATAVAIVNRALRAKTAADSGRSFSGGRPTGLSPTNCSEA